MPHDRRLFGDAGERAAEHELVRRGMRVLARNARTRYGEIDLICHDGRGFVFVEVKTRRASSFVSALEAVDGLKLTRLTHLAEAWLALHGSRSANWRLAVVALTVSGGRATAELLDVEG
ncbi:MAG: YraN family protein [Chloroflexi bacterium GWC2_70_10]|nr:MAG: YraN family protein [Chloroflexi bacterium GWC2_70_10]